MISAQQVKKARELVGWSMDQLSVVSGVSRSTIARLKSSLRNELGGYEENHEKLIRALELAGVIFLDENRDGLAFAVTKRLRS